MAFTNNQITVVTAGLRMGTGSFAERLVSTGLIGNILTAAVASIFNYVLYRRRRRRRWL